MFNRTNTILSVLLVLVAVLSALTGTDYSRPNLEVLPDMKYTPAWKAYEPNPNFPNGRTLQEPVAGTIARGALPLHYSPSKEDALRAGDEIQNPYHLHDAEALEPTIDQAAAQQQAIAQQRLAASVSRGREVYNVFCITCHGPRGAGDGPVPQRGFPPPPSLLTGKSLQMKDGQLFHLLTYGQGSMAPFAGQLSASRRWDVINFIRDMQGSAVSTPAADAQTTAGNPPAATGLEATGLEATGLGPEGASP